MIKTQFKFEVKVPNGSKGVTFTRTDTKDQDQGHKFSESSETFRRSINS